MMPRSRRKTIVAHEMSVKAAQAYIGIEKGEKGTRNRPSGKLHRLQWNPDSWALPQFSQIFRVGVCLSPRGPKPE